MEFWVHVTEAKVRGTITADNICEIFVREYRYQYRRYFQREVSV